MTINNSKGKMKLKAEVVTQKQKLIIIQNGLSLLMLGGLFFLIEVGIFWSSEPIYPTRLGIGVGVSIVFLAVFWLIEKKVIRKVKKYAPIEVGGFLWEKWPLSGRRYGTPVPGFTLAEQRSSMFGRLKWVVGQMPFCFAFVMGMLFCILSLFYSFSWPWLVIGVLFFFLAYLLYRQSLKKDISGIYYFTQDNAIAEAKDRGARLLTETEIELFFERTTSKKVENTVWFTDKENGNVMVFSLDGYLLVNTDNNHLLFTQYPNGLYWCETKTEHEYFGYCFQIYTPDDDSLRINMMYFEDCHLLRAYCVYN